MKRVKQFSKLLLVSALVFAGCEGQEQALIDDRLTENPPQETPEPSGTQGSVDLTKFVSIGNSLTAGYMDGALYNLSQAHSIPALMAQQFEVAVDSDEDSFDGFNQPDINSETGYNTNVSQPDGGPVLGRFKLDTSLPGPSPIVNGEEITAYDGPAVHNFGVPGIQVGQLLVPETGGPADNPAFNPFYQRFAANPGQSTILGEAIAADPTFFSLWIGNNDVLGYAVSGASNPAVLTSTGDFQNRFGTVVDQLMNNTNADGIVADIPPFLGLALFRAVSWNVIELDETTARLLNGAVLSVFNNALDDIVEELGHDEDDANLRRVRYEEGSNPILTVDPNLEDLGPKFDELEEEGIIDADERAALVKYEQARPMRGNIPQLGNELVLLSAGSVLGTLADPNDSRSQIGVVVPLGDQYTLTAAEIQEIETARQTFNGIIESKVGEYSDRLIHYSTNDPEGVFYDIFGLSDGVPGITVSGVDLAPDFSPNGVLSTDGVHPNSRGNAIIANEMLDAIEAKFGATFPDIDVLALPSVQVCAGDCLSQQEGS